MSRFDASQRYFANPLFAGSPLSAAGWARTLTGMPAMAVIERFERGEFDMVAVGRANMARLA